MATLCILIRMFSLFSYTSVYFTIENSSARFLGYFLGFLLSLAMYIPAYYIFKHKDGYNIIDYAKSLSAPMGKITAFLFYLVTIFIASITVSQFDFFITSTIYPNSPKLLFIVILVGVGIYFSTRGLEPIARVANIFFMIFLFGLLFVGFMLSSKINTLNIVSPFYGGLKPILSIAFTVAANNTPLIVYLLLKPNIKEKNQKSYLSYIGISLVIFEIVVFLVVTVLGEYGGTKPFPVYSLISVTQGQILKRYDSLFMFIWIFTALIRFSIYFFLSCKCALEFLPHKFESSRTALSSIFVLVLSSIIIYDIKIFETVAKVADLGIAVSIVGVILPVIIIFIKKYKNKKTSGGLE